MYFDSLSAFFAMGGHGPFVWSVYAITLVVLIGLTVAPLLRMRRFWMEQSMRLKREGYRRGEMGEDRVGRPE